MVTVVAGRHGADVVINNMFKPKKFLGQNFLKNSEVAAKICAAAKIIKSETILEIGPGTGILTEELIKTGAKIFAIEKDFELISLLKKNLGEPKNLKVIHQDALWFNIAQFKSYKVVANIPYSITSPLIRKFLEDPNKPKLLVLMVQKEVAERITAKPGDSNRGLLTLMVEFYAAAAILFEVSRQEFYPVPKVDSAVIRIKPYLKSNLRGWISKVQPEIFFKVVKAGFASKRRQIHNSLAATLQMDKNIVWEILKRSDIDPTFRAEDLSLEQWLNLYQKILYTKRDE